MDGNEMFEALTDDDTRNLDSQSVETQGESEANMVNSEASTAIIEAELPDDIPLSIVELCDELMPETAIVTLTHQVCMFYKPNPHVLPNPFIGKNEEDAYNQLYAFLTKGKEKAEKSETELTVAVNSGKGMGKGKANTGTQWFRDPKTHKLARVAECDIAKYMSLGWFKSGPRSHKVI